MLIDYYGLIASVLSTKKLLIDRDKYGTNGPTVDYIPTIVNFLVDITASRSNLANQLLYGRKTNEKQRRILNQLQTE